MQIMCIEDRAHITQTVSGDRRNLRFRAFRKRQPRYSCPTQVIEC